MTAAKPDSGDGFHLNVAADGQSAQFVLDRPRQRNVQDPAMWDSMLRQLNSLPATVRVLIVRGEGSSFSAGLDRAMLAPGGAVAGLAAAGLGTFDAAVGGFQGAFAALSRPSIVSIAIVQGQAIGAGFQLALACDIRIATEDAEFSMAETQAGLVPSLGGTKRLVELVGYGRALEICLTGRDIRAAEAQRLGLVTSTVGVEELARVIDDLVSRILSAPRSAQIETKALLLSASRNVQLSQEGLERQAQYRLLGELYAILAEDPPN